MTADEQLSIGSVAERTGTAVSALRYYEDRGLIRADRTAGGQRVFPRHVLRRVAFIQVAQRVGLSLEESGEALATLPLDAAPSPEQWAELSAAWRPMLDD